MSLITIYEAYKKNKGIPNINSFHTFGNPGCPILLSHPRENLPFHETIQSFLDSCAEIEDYKVQGAPIWCSLLLNEKNGVVVPLYMVVETTHNSDNNNPFCYHCESLGWSHEFESESSSSERRYHFIIPMDDEWSKPLAASVFVVDTPHILHGLVHSNGFGHLVCVNGIEGGSKFVSGTEVMDLWDRICKALCTRKMSVEDTSRKRSMDLRLLHGVAYGCSWFGRWGFKFWSGNSGVNEHNYEAAVKLFGSLQLDKVVEDFGYNGCRSGIYIKKIVDVYRQMSETQLSTVKDLVKFMLFVKDKSPVRRNLGMTGDVIAPLKTPSKVIRQHKSPMKDKQSNFLPYARVTASRWPSRRLEYAANVIVKALKEQGRGMSRQELRDAARVHIGDTGLIDFVIKSINNHTVDNYVVHRTINPSNKTSLFKLSKLSAEPDSDTIIDPSLDVNAPAETSDLPRVDVYNDVVYLYQQVLERYPKSELVEVATQVILDSKLFVKERPLKEEGGKLLRLMCEVSPTSEEVGADLTCPLPPSEHAVLPQCATTGELKVAISRESEGEIPMKSKTMSSERSKPLHNFSVPSLKWGHQRLLRCMKETPKGETSTLENTRKVPLTCEQSKIEKENQFVDETEGVGERLLIHLQTTADKMKVPIVEEKEEEASMSVPAAKPWNLRRRRAAWFRGMPVFQDVEMEKDNQDESRKFSPSLTAEEIKEDFLMMTGAKPHQRPKKRPRIVQKQLDKLFPGLWLSDVSADSYRVADERDTR